MKTINVKLNAEIRYLIQEALRLEAELNALPANSERAQRLRADQHYHYQELGQHLVWAFQEQA